MYGKCIVAFDTNAIKNVLQIVLLNAYWKGSDWKLGQVKY